MVKVTTGRRRPDTSGSCRRSSSGSTMIIPRMGAIRKASSWRLEATRPLSTTQARTSLLSAIRRWPSTPSLATRQRASVPTLQRLALSSPILQLPRTVSPPENNRNNPYAARNPQIRRPSMLKFLPRLRISAHLCYTIGIQNQQPALPPAALAPETRPPTTVH